MKKIFICSLLIFPALVFAQKNTNSDSVISSNHRFMAYWGVSYNNQSFNNLNTTIASLGNLYEKTPQSIIAWNLGYLNESDLILFKTNIGFGRGTKGNSERKNTVINYFTGSWDIGINLSKGKNTRISPFAGLGGSSFTVTLNKDLANINFNDVLQSSSIQANTTPVKISNMFFNYRVGLAVDFFNPKNNNQALSLFVLYCGSFKNRSWKVNMEQQVANAPIDGLSQLNAGINFMMQYKRKKKTV